MVTHLPTLPPTSTYLEGSGHPSSPPMYLAGDDHLFPRPMYLRGDGHLWSFFLSWMNFHIEASGRAWLIVHDLSIWARVGRDKNPSRTLTDLGWNCHPELSRPGRPSKHLPSTRRAIYVPRKETFTYACAREVLSMYPNMVGHPFIEKELTIYLGDDETQIWKEIFHLPI